MDWLPRTRIALPRNRDGFRPWRQHRAVAVGPLAWYSATLLVDGYAGTWAVMSRLVGELSTDEQAMALDRTATTVYRLGRAVR